MISRIVVMDVIEEDCEEVPDHMDYGEGDSGMEVASLEIVVIEREAHN